MVDLDPLFKVTRAIELFPALGGFCTISGERIKLESSNLVCYYIILRADKKLQMVDLNPLFKVTQMALTYF